MSKRAQVAEQRREDRAPAKGKVRFTLAGSKSPEIQGLLVDSSKNGFRASHSNAEISAGQRVRFRHSRGEGEAVVMWTRILASHVETGFLIVD
jgi:hypothetical protein